jgi:hypothetical protein
MCSNDRSSFHCIRFARIRSFTTASSGQSLAAIWWRSDRDRKRFDPASCEQSGSRSAEVRAFSAARRRLPPAWQEVSYLLRAAKAYNLHSTVITTLNVFAACSSGSHARIFFRVIVVTPAALATNRKCRIPPPPMLDAVADSYSSDSSARDSLLKSRKLQR